MNNDPPLKVMLRGFAVIPLNKARPAFSLLPATLLACFHYYVTTISLMNYYTYLDNVFLVVFIVKMLLLWAHLGI